MVTGPCFKQNDKVVLQWNLQIDRADHLDIAPISLSRQSALFRQPVLPEAAPGRYIVSLVIEGKERANVSFLLSTSLPYFVACATLQK